MTFQEKKITLKPEIISQNTQNGELEFSIGVSQKWNPKEAGHEASFNAVNALKKKPRAVLVFSTIHGKS